MMLLGGLIGLYILYKIIKNILLAIYIKILESKYDCVILPIIHHKRRHIDSDALDQVIDAINEAKKENKKIMAIIHTPGGTVFHSQRIADMLNDCGVEIIGVIPTYAMSGGTLITLPIKKLIATEHAVCGPLDPQIQYGRYFYSIRDMIKVKNDALVTEEFATITETGKRQLSEMRNTIKSYLKEFDLDKQTVSRLTTKLLDAHSHGHGLRIKDIFQFKYEKISDELYDDVMTLIKLSK